MKISASIIVFNEEENIIDLCESLSWCDEIVIVDSESSDRTVELARRYTDKILQHPFKGYKDKHEFADSQTTGDWIFWIDADERVTPELRESIEALRNCAEKELAAGYWIKRRTQYLGRWIKHSGWYPDYQLRLYRKADSYWDGVSPHETARVKGQTQKLDGEFLHYTKRDLSEHHMVLDRYTTLAADYLHKDNRRVSASKIFVTAVAAFLRTYLLKQGFRDGVPGLIVAMWL